MVVNCTVVAMAMGFAMIMIVVAMGFSHWLF
jgi:hypothetical protein